MNDIMIYKCDNEKEWLYIQKYLFNKNIYWHTVRRDVVYDKLFYSFTYPVYINTEGGIIKALRKENYKKIEYGYIQQKCLNVGQIIRQEKLKRING